ncbi:MAG: zinc ribbon domain-containing protein, partial [Methanobrevibacter sp.]|nr:zinc ribbon domain-containing protein [Methanobrevibacter sp.]
MGFCNSCGRPIVKEDYGTNEDGSLNPEFCKDCFQDGKYTEPDITLTEMIVRKSKEMMEKNPRLPETTATGIT